MYMSAPFASPLGAIHLASDGEKLVGLWLEGQKYFADSVRGEVGNKAETYEEAKAAADLSIFAAARQWLDAYFAGKRPGIDALPLAPAGTPFRRAVWDMLCAIPYGQCITYGDIARRMAQRMNTQSMSSQAVGGAVGHNPISIIIPCHRVIGAGGNLTGYAGGIDKKVWLLKLEGVDTSVLYSKN